MKVRIRGSIIDLLAFRGLPGKRKKRFARASAQPLPVHPVNELAARIHPDMPQETFDRDEFILKAFDRFNIGGGLYGAERLYHHLEKMGKIDLTTIEKWQALKDCIEKEMEDTANCVSNPILRNAARKRMDELKAAKLEPTKAEEWIKVATMRHIVEGYFRKCYLSKVSPV